MTEAGDGFTRSFFGEMAFRMAVAVLAMNCSFAGGWIGERFGDDWESFVGAVAGLSLGVWVGMLLFRRRRRQESVATGRDGSATHSLHEPG